MAEHSDALPRRDFAKINQGGEILKQTIKDEILNAIKIGQIERKDTGAYRPGHSDPYFFKTSDGQGWCLLRVRKDSKHASQQQIAQSYERYKTLFPFLKKQNLGVLTPSEIEIIAHDGEIYGVMERFSAKAKAP